MSIICFGELLIDFVATEANVTVGDADTFQKVAGGGVANVAFAVSRLGTPSAFIGQVGDDPFGHYLAGALAADGVDVRGLRFSKEARTMLAFVSLAADGERSFVFFRNPSADMLMVPADVDFELIASGKMLHFGTITQIHEPSRSATLAGVQHALDHGLKVSLDPNLRLNLWESAEAARQCMLDSLDYAHIVKLSDEEVEFLTGSQDISTLWRDRTEIIVVTHGAAGATLHTRTRTYHQPGFKVAPVDSTGAGDGFVGGLLVRLLAYGDEAHNHLDDVLRFANASGALATTRRGAGTSLATRDEVEALLAAQL